MLVSSGSPFGAFSIVAPVSCDPITLPQASTPSQSTVVLLVPAPYFFWQLFCSSCFSGAFICTYFAVQWDVSHAFFSTRRKPYLSSSFLLATSFFIWPLISLVLPVVFCWTWLPLMLHTLLWDRQRDYRFWTIRSRFARSLAADIFGYDCHW